MSSVTHNEIYICLKFLLNYKDSILVILSAHILYLRHQVLHPGKTAPAGALYVPEVYNSVTVRKVFLKVFFFFK